MEKNAVTLEDIKGLWVGFTSDKVTKYYLDIKKINATFEAKLSLGLVHILSNELITSDSNVKFDLIKDLDYMLTIGEIKFSINFESEKNISIMSRNIIKELFIIIDNNKIEFYKN
ncbi:hypothetical protein [uncultured Aquimarina sp.]|uniref:hypothetical protein n=1 Tax=uncultured Aquimarina sp. TaxID=575652 RepID=UPI0026354BB1|nr:hypothetical protein [uncultured Aquimarina sp.]